MFNRSILSNDQASLKCQIADKRVPHRLFNARIPSFTLRAWTLYSRDLQRKLELL